MKNNFEVNIERLEEIVNILENEGTSLEKSFELYKEGVDISGKCKKILDKIEGEVVLLNSTEDGFFEEDFMPLEEE